MPTDRVAVLRVELWMKSIQGQLERISRTYSQGVELCALSSGGKQLDRSSGVGASTVCETGSTFVKLP